jgi:hypothetical protein
VRESQEQRILEQRNIELQGEGEKETVKSLTFCCNVEEAMAKECEAAYARVRMQGRLSLILQDGRSHGSSERHGAPSSEREGRIRNMINTGTVRFGSETPVSVRFGSEPTSA